MSISFTMSIDLNYSINSPNSIPLKNHPFFFTKPYKTPLKKPTFLCSSQKPDKTRKSPSLSDQLKPLSTTILAENGKQLVSKQAKSVWVNPTKPKPSVLNLQRHKRAPNTFNPKIRELRLFAKRVNEIECVGDCKEEFGVVFKEMPDGVNRENVLLVLNSLKPWEKAVAFFEWVKNEGVVSMETIFYNVVMKSLRFGKRFDVIERLANEMIEDGVVLDNITYSTIISCAKRCGLYDKAVEWFERMYKTGVMPDEVTYSAVLEVYAKIGKVEEVMSLYERGRASGWMPDQVAFSVLCKMFGDAGDYDGIKFVLEEMKGLGVQPNLVVYNTLLEAMGKAGKPGFARSLFEEMVESGLTPNEKTLTALVKVYGKARWSRDALELWERMKSNGWPMDFILYNTLLSMCADLGLEEEAEKLFEDMKQSEKCRPDIFTYTAMLNIYGSGGKVDRAMELFDEMSEVGVQLNVMGCTCLVQCLGRSKRIDDLVRIFDVSIKRGIKPDDRLCGCLLSVVSICDDIEAANKVLGCLERSNPKLVAFIRLINDKETKFETVREEFKAILNDTQIDARRPFCNCLIDICRNRNLQERAHELLYLGTVFGLYPGLHKKSTSEWSLNVRSLSIGAAETAFEEWMTSLSNVLKRQEALPTLFTAYTGAGTHKFSQGLASSFGSHVEKLAAPFKLSEERAGCFVATRDDLVSWVHSRDSSPVLSA